MEARIARLESDVGHLRSDVTEIKFDDVKASIAGVKAWTLTIHIGLAVAIFGTMARGFGWK